MVKVYQVIRNSLRQ